MFRQSNLLTATVWKDKKPVHIISTLSQPGEVGSVLRKEKDGSRVTVSCPTSILMYTKYMRGVDRGDQLRKYYSVRLKCNKNYKYVFWFLFDVCITNAFILSKLCTGPEPTTRDEGRLKAFHAQLAKALIGEYNSRQRAGRRSSKGAQQPSPPHITFHSPHHHNQQRCVFCSQHHNPPRRRESVWQCIQCEGIPTLCLTGREDGSDCWSLWHRASQ